MGALNFDRVADIYDATRGLPQPVMQAVLSTMRQALSDCETLIDVGVGTGRFAGPLQDMGFRVVGIDVSQDMLAKASQRRVERLVVADAHSLPFISKSFDAAIVVHLLHLVEDWKRVVREVCGVTRTKVISLVGRTEGPSTRSEYIRLRSRFGFPWNRFEEGEEGLRKIVQPTQIIEATRYSSEIKADEDIEYLEKRGSAVTWNLDEAVHSKIVAELRASHGGKILSRSSCLEIAVWRPDQLVF